MIGHNSAHHDYLGAFTAVQHDIGSQGLQGGRLWAEGWGNTFISFNASDYNNTYSGPTIRPDSYSTKFYIKF